MTPPSRGGGIQSMPASELFVAKTQIWYSRWVDNPVRVGWPSSHLKECLARVDNPSRLQISLSRLLLQFAWIRRGFRPLGVYVRTRTQTLQAPKNSNSCNSSIWIFIRPPLLPLLSPDFQCVTFHLFSIRLPHAPAAVSQNSIWSCQSFADSRASFWS